MPRGWRWHTGLLARDSRVIASAWTAACAACAGMGSGVVVSVRDLQQDSCTAPVDLSRLGERAAADRAAARPYRSAHHVSPWAAI